MDYHDLRTKLYSTWGHHVPAYGPVGQTLLRVPFHVLFIRHDATINMDCTYKVISYGARGGIRTRVRRVQSNRSAIWAVIHWHSPKLRHVQITIFRSRLQRLTWMLHFRSIKKYRKNAIYAPTCRQVIWPILARTYHKYKHEDSCLLYHGISPW